MLELNRRLMLLAWILSMVGWLLAWAIDRWMEAVTPGGLRILGAASLLMAPATWWVRRASARTGARVAYGSLVGIVTAANLAFQNTDLWILYFLLGLVRVVYKDSFLHLTSAPLSMALYGIVVWLNPSHALNLSNGQIVVRLFILFCFHAISHVIHLSVDDFRPRGAKTALRMLGQLAIRRLRRRRRRPSQRHLSQ